MQVKLQRSLDVFFGLKKSRSREKTFNDYIRILRGKARNCVSQDGFTSPETTAEKIRNLIESIDLGFPGDRFPLKTKSPCKVELNSHFREILDIPPSIIEDICFGRIFLSLESRDDIILLLSSIKSCLFRYFKDQVLTAIFTNPESVLEEKGILSAQYTESFLSRFTGKKVSAFGTVESVLSILVLTDPENLGWKNPELSSLITAYHRVQVISGISAVFKKIRIPIHIRKPDIFQGLKFPEITFPALHITIPPGIPHFIKNLRQSVFSFFTATRAYTVSSVLFIKQTLKSIRIQAPDIQAVQWKKILKLVPVTFIVFIPPAMLMLCHTVGDHKFALMERPIEEIENQARQTYEELSIPELELESKEQIAAAIPPVEEEKTKTAVELEEEKKINLEDYKDYQVKQYEELKAKLKEPVRGIYYFEDLERNFFNKITLTFDDGPNLEKINYYTDNQGTKEVSVTEYILDILKKYRIQSVFFLNGKNFYDDQGIIIPEAKYLVDRMIKEGHLIANHTFAHHNLARGEYKGDLEKVKNEIIKNEQALDELLGYHYEMKYFRPPYAEAGRDETVEKAVQDLKKEIILFQIDSFDYLIREETPEALEQAFKKIKREVTHSTGGPILLHDLPVTALHLENIIHYINTFSNDQGNLTFVPLKTLINDKYRYYR